MTEATPVSGLPQGLRQTLAGHFGPRFSCGHLGFADFNARLRNDAPALLELLVDDTLLGRWTISDSQGWAAFAAPTTPGTHDVRLRLTTLLGGSWTEQGYGPQPRRSACLELRALSEAHR